MTIHVNISDFDARLSELVAAAVRGEDVVFAEAGKPRVRLVAVADAATPTPMDSAERERITAKRKAAFGMFAKDFEGFDIDISALRADRSDPDERWRRKFGPAA